jgi:hypothetical protein
VKWVVIDVWQTEHWWECFDQLAPHVAGELVRATEEHCRFRIIGVRIVTGVLSSEIVWVQTEGGRAVGDTVVETTSDERDIAGGELECRLWVVEPQPGMAPDHGVDGELDGARQAHPPRGSCD